MCRRDAGAPSVRILEKPLVLFGGDAGVGHLATGVDEGDELGGVLFEGVLGDLVAVLEQGVQKMQDSDFTADAFELGGVDLGTLAEEIGGGLRLGAGALVDELGLTVVLETSEPPVAKVVFVEVFAGFTEAFDDDFVRHAVVEHDVDLVTEFGGEAGDFAVTTGTGLAGLEFSGEGIPRSGRLFSEGVHKGDA